MSMLSIPKQRPPARGLLSWLIGLCVLLLVGFWLRLSFYLGEIYHIDEFISMLASTMVAQHGLPILPSGLFYDHGLLFSFVSGAFVALLGFSEEVARWPTLLISVFTIAAYYAVARQIFDSRTPGVLAVVLVTFDSLSIEWGARARMYAIAHLFVLLSIVWLLKSTLQQPSQRNRYLFLLFLVGALFSHTISFLIVPILAILLFIFTLVYSRDWLRSRRLWQEVLLTLLVLITALAIVAMGQTGSTVSVRDATANAAAPLGLEFLRGFFSPGLEWSRFDDLVGFFLVPAYRWLLFAIVAALLITLYRVLRRMTTFADVAFLFLALFGVMVILEIGGLLTHSWQKTRYLFILASPAFLLLSAESLNRLTKLAVRLLAGTDQNPHWGKWAQIAVRVTVISIVLGVWGPASWNTATGQGTGNYNTAFAFVRENWQPGDRVMTVHPSAAYLYLGRSDYYASQTTARILLDDETEEPVDRYVGSDLLDSVEELNQVLSEDGRLWFVVDTNRLFSRYELFFVQQAFAQMDVVYRSGDVLVFLSRPYPQPVPAEPMVNIHASFSDLIKLEGYSLDLSSVAPDGTVQLGLYWRPGTAKLSQLYKVFVQLRDEQDQIVAQADHFIFENFLTGSVIEQARQQGECLRDTADLKLPQQLPSATYRLLVGLYDPDTFERVPVVDDQSGENAVILKTVVVP